MVVGLRSAQWPRGVLELRATETAPSNAWATAGWQGHRPRWRPAGSVCPDQELAPDGGTEAVLLSSMTEKFEQHDRFDRCSVGLPDFDYVVDRCTACEALRSDRSIPHRCRAGRHELRTPTPRDGPAAPQLQT